MAGQVAEWEEEKEQSAGIVIGVGELSQGGFAEFPSALTLCLYAY